MNAVKKANTFVSAGEFLNALKALENGDVDREEQIESEILKAELFEKN